MVLKKLERLHNLVRDNHIFYIKNLKISFYILKTRNFKVSGFLIYNFFVNKVKNSLYYSTISTALFVSSPSKL